MEWNVNTEDMTLISQIADRFAEIAEKQNSKINKLAIDMDITACHCNGNPLKLKELLGADSFDFTHDVLGIIYNIDRETGELKNCFSPRFSK